MADMREDFKHEHGSRLVGVVATLLVCLVFYLAPLLIVAVDEFVLRTYWVSKTFPHEFKAVFRTIYPFIRFLVG